LLKVTSSRIEVHESRQAGDRDNRQSVLLHDLGCGLPIAIDEEHTESEPPQGRPRERKRKDACLAESPRWILEIRIGFEAEHLRAQRIPVRGGKPYYPNSSQQQASDRQPAVG